MSKIVKTILSSRAVVPVLTLTGIAFFGVAASAVEIPQRTINGVYYPTGSQQFFEEGRRRFEREVQVFIQGRLYSPKTLLQVSEELRSQQEILHLENFQPKPSDRHKSRGNQFN